MIRFGKWIIRIVLSLFLLWLMTAFGAALFAALITKNTDCGFTAPAPCSRTAFFFWALDWNLFVYIPVLVVVPQAITSFIKSDIPETLIALGVGFVIGLTFSIGFYLWSARWFSNRASSNSKEK